MQLYGSDCDPLPFSGVESIAELDPRTNPRSSKRRRMSNDSATEPPSSAVSFSSFSSGEGYTSASSTSSHRSWKGSVDFPFPPYNSNGAINQGPALCGSGNTFWHPPMTPQPQSDAEPFWHPSRSTYQAQRNPPLDDVWKKITICRRRYLGQLWFEYPK
jgi:GATA-binding protein